MRSNLPSPSLGPVASSVYSLVLAVTAYGVQSNPSAPTFAWAAASLLSCVLIVGAFRSISN